MSTIHFEEILDLRKKASAFRAVSTLFPDICGTVFATPGRTTAEVFLSRVDASIWRSCVTDTG
jgi:hypothetical protein